MEPGNDKVDIDDAIRWLGNRKPVAFAWYGLALLEIAAAIFIVMKAYVMYSTEIDDAPSTMELLEFIKDREISQAPRRVP